MDPYCPFTAAQWQELELQALFFRFMMSGNPIPPDLIFNINRNRSKTNQPQSQNIGIGMAWSFFEQGRKTDPEPTRCRRTDGKKWRCSRQTSVDSKYCERHIHRGKSRPGPTSKLVQTVTGSHSNLASHSSATANAKDASFMTVLSIGSDPDERSTRKQKQKALLCSDDVMKRKEKRERMMKMYHQFIEESPSPTHEKRDSWLSLVI